MTINGFITGFILQITGAIYTLWLGKLLLVGFVSTQKSE